MVTVVSTIHAGLRLENLGVKFVDGKADVPESILNEVLKFEYLGVFEGATPQGSVEESEDSELIDTSDSKTDILDIPRGNASLEDWIAYADFIGVPIPEDATRNQIRDLFEN